MKERWRRIYRGNGSRCEDCGQRVPVTRVSFWVNGWQCWFCKNCIKPYRTQLVTRFPLEWGRVVRGG